jgi:hypothetical protein
MGLRHLPCTPLGVASSDLLTQAGYPDNAGHYRIVRDAAIYSTLDVALLSSEQAIQEGNDPDSSSESIGAEKDYRLDF